MTTTKLPPSMQKIKDELKAEVNRLSSIVKCPACGEEMYHCPETFHSTTLCAETHDYRFKKEKELEAEIERLKASPVSVWDKHFFLTIINNWKNYWMHQTQNSKEDYDNYFGRAFGIDANMKHHLASELFKATQQSKSVADLTPQELLRNEYVGKLVICVKYRNERDPWDIDTQALKPFTEEKE